jgi:hypothetical protein
MSRDHVDVSDPLSRCHSERRRSSATRSDGKRGTPRMFVQPCRLREFQRQQKLPRHPDDRKAAARLLRAPSRARFWREWAERGRREEISCACLSVSPAMSRHQLHMPVGVITAPSMYFGSISGHARRSIHQFIEILNTQCPAGEMFYAGWSRHLCLRTRSVCFGFSH